MQVKMCYYALMVFLYSLVGFICSYTILKVGTFLFNLIKKKEMGIKSLFLRSLPDDVVTLCFNFVIALIIFLLFKGTYAFNAICMFFVFSLLLLLISPYSTLKKAVTSRDFKSRRLWCGSLAVALMVLEVFAFNAAGLNQKGDEIFYSLSDTSVIAKTNTQDNKDGTHTITTGASFVVSGLDQHKNEVLQLCFKDAPSSLSTVTFYSQIENTYKWQTLMSYDINPSISENCQIRIPTTVTATSKITISIDSGRNVTPSNLTLTGFKINSHILFLFSPLRFLVLTGIVYFFAYLREIFSASKEKLSLTPTKSKFTLTQKAYISAGAIGIVSTIAFIIIAFANKDFFFYTKEYVTTNVQNNGLVDIYADLFLSLTKGSIRLNITPSQSLLAAEANGLNVYDRVLRSTQSISAVWDHAYYKGNYYCYYGILPAILVYFPLYWLSGCTLIPRAITASIIGEILLVPVFSLLLLELSKLTGKKENIRHFVFVFAISFITSMMIPLVTFKEGYFHESIYHLPIVYALLNLDLFFLFTLRAYRKENKRLWNLLLAGLAYVFIIACRPNLCFSVLIVAPLFIKMLFFDKKKFSKRLLDFLPMFGVLIVGAVLICLYNYARFDSIFEFGQSYQINNDQTHLTYSSDKLFPSIIHWLFQGPVFYDEFPFISCSVMKLSFDNVPYNQGYYGVLLVPCFWLAFINVFLYKKDNWVRSMVGIIPLFIILEAFTTYSKAGICARYLLETYHIATLGSAFAYFMILGDYENKKEPSLNTPLFLSAIALSSAFICFNLSYDSFDGQNIGDLGGILVKIKEAFLSFNY